jgi:hypothetical protein
MSVIVSVRHSRCLSDSAWLSRWQVVSEDRNLVQIDYVGNAPDQKMLVTIYYWGHDQSEERPLEEFFRGEQHSLIQWQPQAPLSHVGMQVGSMPGIPMQGMPMQAMAMQGMPVAGGMALGQSMYAVPSNADLVTAQPIVNQVLPPIPRFSRSIGHHKPQRAACMQGMLRLSS